MRSFKSLSEQEILALAISLEEEDARIYDDFADGLQSEPSPAQAEEFRRHARTRRTAIAIAYSICTASRFGEHIPLIRRQDVKGFVRRRPVWLVRPLGIGRRAQAGRAHGAGDRTLLRDGRSANRPTQACGNCWAISPRRNAARATSPRE